MKKTTIKRAAALLLTVVFALSASACASFADMVKGFADAATYMRGESNVRSEMTLSVKFSENAKYMTFAEFLSEYQNIPDEDSVMGWLTDLAAEAKVGLSVVTELYEDTALVSLGWIGPGGTETLLTLILIDQTLYISTEVLGYAGHLDALAEYGEILALIDCDYIKIDLSTVPGMLEMFGEIDLELQQTEEAQAAIQSAVDTLADVLREYTPKVLTQDYQNVLTKGNGGYTLTLNAETALALLGEIISLMAEYETDVKAFLLETGGEFGLDAEILEDIDFQEVVLEFEKMLEESATDEDVLNFDLVYAVAGEGKDADKKQTSSFSLTLSVDEEDIPFDKVLLEGGSVSTVTTQPVTVPEGKSLSLEELMMRLMFSSMDMGSLGL